MISKSIAQIFALNGGAKCPGVILTIPFLKVKTLAILIDVRKNLSAVLICISLIIKDVEHFFKSFSAIWYSFAENSVLLCTPVFKLSYLVLWSLSS